MFWYCGARVYTYNYSGMNSMKKYHYSGTASWVTCMSAARFSFRVAADKVKPVLFIKHVTGSMQDKKIYEYYL